MKVLSLVVAIGLMVVTAERLASESLKSKTGIDGKWGEGGICAVGWCTPAVLMELKTEARTHKVTGWVLLIAGRCSVGKMKIGGITVDPCSSAKRCGIERKMKIEDGSFDGARFTFRSTVTVDKKTTDFLWEGALIDGSTIRVTVTPSSENCATIERNAELHRGG